eukprot:2034820-Pleurochrysis_carterae.AAC.2
MRCAQRVVGFVALGAWLVHRRYQHRRFCRGLESHLKARNRCKTNQLSRLSSPPGSCARKVLV